MQLQQLRYVIAIAENGSMNSVAKTLFVSQSSLSVSVRELEKELGIRIFNRSSRGITLTSEGVEFLGYARQVVEQADLLERHYSKAGQVEHQRLSVSSQHYAFAVRAFISFVSGRQDDSCEFSLRETRTRDVIEDVSSFRSDIGIIYLCNYNEHVLKRQLDDADLSFSSLFRARPHVFVRKGHPLAKLDLVRLDDLAQWPRCTFEQGPKSSLYLSEEPLSNLPHTRRIVASDRGTMTSLLTNYDGFLISTGVRSDEMFQGIVSIPLETDEVMNVGYITHALRRLSPLACEYLNELKKTIVGFNEPSMLSPSRSVLRDAGGAE